MAFPPFPQVTAAGFSHRGLPSAQYWRAAAASPRSAEQNRENYEIADRRRPANWNRCRPIVRLFSDDSISVAPMKAPESATFLLHAAIMLAATDGGDRGRRLTLSS